ncbi:MAG: hypothetical protein ABR521_11150 [Gaiellaceae bacterium]
MGEFVGDAEAVAMTVEVSAKVRVDALPSSRRFRIDEDGEAIAVEGRERCFDATHGATECLAADDHARCSAEALEVEERGVGLSVVEDLAELGGVIRGRRGRGDGHVGGGANERLRRKTLSPEGRGGGRIREHTFAYPRGLRGRTFLSPHGAAFTQKRSRNGRRIAAKSVKTMK